MWHFNALLFLAHTVRVLPFPMPQGRVPGTSMLVRNYRSHRRLLDLPSKLFYKGSLVAAADPRSGAAGRLGPSLLCAALPCMAKTCVWSMRMPCPTSPSACALVFHDFRSAAATLA